MLRSRSLLLLFLALAVPAHAGVYKCANEKGVVYQDTACAPGKELRNLDTDPANLSVVPGTPLSTQWSTQLSRQPSRKPRKDDARRGAARARGPRDRRCADRRLDRSGAARARRRQPR